MSEGTRKIRSDIVGTDGVVLLLHGKIASVFDSLEPEQNLFDSYNYSLVALRPSDLDDREKVREKLVGALKAVVSGEFDPVFRKAARVLGPDGHTPESLRLAAAQILARHLGSPEELDEVIREFKATVREAHRLGVSPSDDGKLDALRSYLESDRSPLTASLDRYLAAERVPFVVSGQGDGALQKSRRGGSSLRRPSDASAFIVVGGFQENDAKARGQAGFMLSHLITDQFITGNLKLSSNTELEHLPGVDFQKMKYQLGRKRKELAQHNRNAQLPIRMFPDEKTAAFVRANSPDTSARAAASDLHDPACNLGEAHHLLTHYADEADRHKVSDRFDHVVQFHDAAMVRLNQKAEEHLNEARLPPMQLQDLQGSPDADPQPADRTPLTA
ncbi:S8/S53 family peptidase, partial [Singulisphaera rosea]